MFEDTSIFVHLHSLLSKSAVTEKTANNQCGYKKTVFYVDFKFDDMGFKKFP
jgi:hypothetical protein